MSPSLRSRSHLISSATPIEQGIRLRTHRTREVPSSIDWQCRRVTTMIYLVSTSCIHRGVFKCWLHIRQFSTLFNPAFSTSESKWHIAEGAMPSMYGWKWTGTREWTGKAVQHACQQWSFLILIHRYSMHFPLCYCTWFRILSLKNTPFSYESVRDVKILLAAPSHFTIETLPWSERHSA